VCRQAKKEATWIKTKTACKTLLLTQTKRVENAGCNQPCLNEIVAGHDIDNGNGKVDVYDDLIYDNPTTFITNMYKDPGNKMCHSAKQNPLTLVASQANVNWPLMTQSFSGNAATERQNQQGFVQGAISMRHDTRKPEIIFSTGFTSANIDTGHPDARHCGGSPRWSFTDLQAHQVNNKPTTYCNIISTTNCIGVGFFVSWTYAVVVPEAYDYVHEVDGEGNSEIMAFVQIPNTHVYAARQSKGTFNDVNTITIDRLWPDNKGKPRETAPDPEIVFNPLFNVVLTSLEEEALQAMLHVSCDRALGQTPDTCRL